MPPIRREYVTYITEELLFIWIFLIIIFSWILIDLWGVFLKNFFYVTLQLNEKSSYDTFIVALCATSIIILMIIYLKYSNHNLQPNIYNDNENSNENSDRDISFTPLREFSFFGPL